MPSVRTARVWEEPALRLRKTPLRSCTIAGMEGWLGYTGAMNIVVSDRTTELQALCRRYHVASLAVFGSALTSAFVPALSDLDFVVRFTPMDPIAHADAYLGLLTSLERLFDRPIDLVEDDAVRNRYLRREIDGTRQVVYGA